MEITQAHWPCDFLKALFEHTFGGSTARSDLWVAILWFSVSLGVQRAYQLGSIFEGCIVIFSPTYFSQEIKGMKLPIQLGCYCNCLQAQTPMNLQRNCKSLMTSMRIYIYMLAKFWCVLAASATRSAKICRISGISGALFWEDYQASYLSDIGACQNLVANLIRLMPHVYAPRFWTLRGYCV